MSIEQLKVDLQTAIQQAEHKPGDWSQTAQSMGGICCPGEKFQIGKPWPKEEPWAQFSYKRDSWLAVAAVNALPALLAEIERLEAQVRLAGVSAEMAVHQEVGRAATEALAIAAERDQFKAENERLRGLLAPVADGIQQKRQRWLDNIAAAIRVGLPKSLRQDLGRTYAEIQSSIQHGGGRNLLAEIERLTEENSLFRQCTSSVNAAVALENDALRQDAERYRGVRRVANRQGFTDEQFDQQTDARLANFEKAMAKVAPHV